MTSSLHSKCKRCGKDFTSTTCPYCTVTGLDLEALLAEEGLTLNPKIDQEEDIPVALIDTVTGKPLPVVSPVCKVGRDITSDIVIAGDRSLSRYHFQIRVWGDEFFIEDCGSRNGTFLNGSPISTPRKLANGDVVSAGMSRYTFSLKASGNYGGRDSALDSIMNQSEPPASPKTEPPGSPIGKTHPLPPPPGGPAPVPVPVPQPAKNEFSQSLERMRDSVLPVGGPAVLASVTEPISKKNYPDWSKLYAPPEFGKLMEERERLVALIEKGRRDLQELDARIAGAGSLSSDLLCDEGDALATRVKEVITALGWTVEWAAANHLEMSLRLGNKIEAVLRIVGCVKEPPTSDMEAVVNQQAVVWCQFTYEPKGIIVLQQNSKAPPEQRAPLSRDFSESAAKKKLCVVTTPQLLTIFRLLSAGNGDRDYIKQLLVSTNGLLPGFTPMREPGQ